jgi:hypothetical protein
MASANSEHGLTGINESLKKRKLSRISLVIDIDSAVYLFSVIFRIYIVTAA